jgi:UDP-N-acetylglucosamine 2-epimerase
VLCIDIVSDYQCFDVMTCSMGTRREALFLQVLVSVMKRHTERTG